MTLKPIFLSLVITIRNQANEIQPLLVQVSQLLSGYVSDHEIIIIDCASNDDTLLKLKALTAHDGLPNLQVYCLTKEVDVYTAAWVGLENALGDFVAVIDPLTDDVSFLPELIDNAVDGADVVFARNVIPTKKRLAYRATKVVFNRLYKWLSGIDLAIEAPQYRILSRAVVNFILQHPQPPMTYRHLPSTGGFFRVNLNYTATPKGLETKKLSDSIDLGMRLLVSTTRAPMRIVTIISLFGAAANVVYSIYVVAIGFLKSDVAAGWISLSLQQSGMFFLISLVLLVLGEYILNMVSLSNEGPPYHIGQEFTSLRITRHEKLNIEEVAFKKKS